MAWPFGPQAPSWVETTTKRRRRAVSFFMKARLYPRKRGSRSCRVRKASPPRLELYLRADLNLARRVDKVAVGVGDGAEQRVEGAVNVEFEARSCRGADLGSSSRRCYVGGGNSVPGRVYARNVLLVGDVEEVRQEFDVILLSDLEALGDAQVGAPVVWLAEDVASDIRAVGAAGTVDSSHGGAGRIAADRHGVRQAVLDLVDRRNRPVIQQVLRPARELPRRLHHRGQDKAIGHVVDGVAVLAVETEWIEQ